MKPIRHTQPPRNGVAVKALVICLCLCATNIYYHVFVANHQEPKKSILPGNRSLFNPALTLGLRASRANGARSNTPQSTVLNRRRFSLRLLYATLLLLLSAGDIEINPGPPKRWMYPCGACLNPVRATYAPTGCTLDAYESPTTHTQNYSSWMTPGAVERSPSKTLPPQTLSSTLRSSLLLTQILLKLWLSRPPTQNVSLSCMQIAGAFSPSLNTSKHSSQLIPPTSYPSAKPGLMTQYPMMRST